MLEALTLVAMVSSCVDVGNVKSVVNGDSVDSPLFVEDASVVLSISIVEDEMYGFVIIEENMVAIVFVSVLNWDDDGDDDVIVSNWLVVESNKVEVSEISVE